MPITKSDLGVVIARSHLYLLLPNEIPGGRGRWVIVDLWGERVKTVEEWEGMETIKPVDNWVPPRYLCWGKERKRKCLRIILRMFGWGRGYLLLV